MITLTHLPIIQGLLELPREAAHLEWGIKKADDTSSKELSVMEHSGLVASRSTQGWSCKDLDDFS